MEMENTRKYSIPSKPRRGHALIFEAHFSKKRTNIGVLIPFFIGECLEGNFIFASLQFVEYVFIAEIFLYILNENVLDKIVGVLFVLLVHAIDDSEYISFSKTFFFFRVRYSIRGINLMIKHMNEIKNV